MNVTVLVQFPSRRVCQGARVEGTISIRNPRRASGITGQDGTCVVPLDTTGVVGIVALEFRATVLDSLGVEWTGNSVYRWTLVYTRAGTPAPKREALIVLGRVPREVPLELNPETFGAIERSDGGALLLADVEELVDSLRASLPSASVALVSKVLDGSIKIRGRARGWWRADWDRLPTGALIAEPEVKRLIIERIGDGGWERLRGSAVSLRNVGAHHLSEQVSIDEAMGSARVLFDFLPRWWRSIE